MPPTNRTAPAAEAYTIQGRTVILPAVVRDAGSGNAIFLVPAAAAQRFVGDAYEVVEMMPGQTQLILGFVDYRDNDLGKYHEGMVVFMVRPRGGAPGSEGTFIYRLPVDQSFTCEAGVRIWGFPKTIERIDISYAADRATCRLMMGGQHVFTLTVPRKAAAAEDAPNLDLLTYTYRDGPTVVPFTTGGHGASVGVGGEGVELLLGTHPIADDLRRLGLPTPALMSTWTEHLHGTFGAPRKL